MTEAVQAEVLVIGSGAGGATTALELAHAGFGVVVMEEGARHAPDEYGKDATVAMSRLYRRRGMTPIMGRPVLGYVEGCCLGGSTEINSGFWHKTPREVLLRWRSQFDLMDAMPADLEPHFAWAAQQLGVGAYPGAWPPSTQYFAKGIEAMGWAGEEIPRVAPECRGANRCASGCATGAKQGMSARMLPAAQAAGARVLTRCRARLLVVRKGRVTGVVADLQHDDGSHEVIRVDADAVFVCCGPTETPGLLRRSGIRYRVGDTLRIHPMLKVAAKFPEPVDAYATVLPLMQVKEFWPAISLGGAYASLGHIAMVLSDNWPQLGVEMDDYRRIALYYVGVRGTGEGSVRSSILDDGEVHLRYQVSDEDMRNLGAGLARLSTLLLAAGASEVFPAVQGLPRITNELEAVRWLDERLRPSSVSLTTVHAFSSCPMGERTGRTAANSFGRLHGFENLMVNGASMLPDSPGVNPQGSVMAFARRNACYFKEMTRR